MTIKRVKNKVVLAVLLVIILPVGFICAQTEISDADIKKAVDLYEQGQYEFAMDSFIDVLQYGNQQQRELAEKYINEINVQMSKGVMPESGKTAVETDKSPAEPVTREPAAVLSENEQEKDSVAAVSTESISPEVLFDKPEKIIITEPVAPYQPAQAQQVQPFVEDGQRFAAMQIEKRQESILKAIGSYPDVEVRRIGDMIDAIIINPEEIFSDKINFKAETWHKLSYIAGLLFTLKDADFTILAPGVQTEDSTLLDMRRAMAVNTIMLKEGISRARLKVRLSALEEEDLFARLDGTDGIVILVSYDKKYSLKKLITVKPHNKPEVTLGVYPNAINPYKGNGVIIEFAVIETYAQIKSWKFELAYLGKNGMTIPVKTLYGNLPQFHNIYWNGRENFNGQYYSGGKYVCKLSAEDVTGKQITAVKQFSVIAPKRNMSTIMASARITQSMPVPVVQSNIVPQSNDMQIDFADKSLNIDAVQFQKIRKAAKVLMQDKNRRIKLLGFSYSKRFDGANYALKRVRAISEILMQEYMISPDRIEEDVSLGDGKPYILMEMV
jgi:hypothetical protein